MLLLDAVVRNRCNIFNEKITKRKYILLGSKVDQSQLIEFKIFYNNVYYRHEILKRIT